MRERANRFPRTVKLDARLRAHIALVCVSMREFRLGENIGRLSLGSYQLPLGVSATSLTEPEQGFTVRFQEGTEEEPDTYVFHAVISHEKLRPLVDAAFNLLPKEVTPVVEIGSRDAYRTVDIYLAEEPISLVDFLRGWYEFEDVLLEDVTIGVGANSEEPWVDVFVDSWKGVLISVPVEMRDEVEKMLEEHGLTEVVSTWDEDLREGENSETDDETLVTRDVLEILDDHSPDLDELLLILRERWLLELNVDRETNVDDAGRHLGMTLWHAIVLAISSEGDAERGAYISVWMTAGSLAQAEELLEDALLDHPQWVFESVYTMDRVAFDDRAPSLTNLPHTRRRPAVHELDIEPWGEDGADGAPGGSEGGPDRTPRDSDDDQPTRGDDSGPSGSPLPPTTPSNRAPRRGHGGGPAGGGNGGGGSGGNN
ncbi:MAG: hypothetical protein DWH97_09665 [Planctomycetota bacterium]|nr:MAG: hypothetical protein DWH97_09665 [Planctomycetota bacterium]